MKHFLRFSLLIVTVLMAPASFSQNVMINALTQNSGVVKKDGTVFFEVTINNTSATYSIAAYKLKPQISFPATIVAVPATGHNLPKGWSILSNNNGVLTLSNGEDAIPANESRTILIAVQGKAIGGPSSVIANLSFSNGTAPGSAAGAAPAGDNMADNASTSTIRVIK